MNWISVKDKKPNINTKVAYKMADDKVDFGGYNGTDFWTFDPTGNSEVTHWMYFDVYWNEKNKP